MGTCKSEDGTQRNQTESMSASAWVHIKVTLKGTSGFHWTRYLSNFEFLDLLDLSTNVHPHLLWCLVVPYFLPGFVGYCKFTHFLLLKCIVMYNYVEVLKCLNKPSKCCLCVNFLS